MSRLLSSSCTAAQSAPGRSVCNGALRAGGYSRHSNSSSLKLSHVSSRPALCARSTYSATLALPTPLARLACRWLKPHTNSKRNTSWTFRILSLLAGICLPSEAECHGVGALLAAHSDSKPATIPTTLKKWPPSRRNGWPLWPRNGWPPSRRNGGRLRVGMGGRIRSESARAQGYVVQLEELGPAMDRGPGP